MISDNNRICTAFAGSTIIGSGSLREVALQAKPLVDRGESSALLIFDDVTSELVEVDFRGAPSDVLQRLPVEPEQEREEARGPGRPRLGVVAREVTLLPRHWEWLASQPGGASVALRKLVDQARSTSMDADRKRQALEAAYRFLSAMAGNEPGFEEAVRALFGSDLPGFDAKTALWPRDVRDHGRKLAARALEAVL